jgi:hypothetical protein
MKLIYIVFVSLAILLNKASSTSKHRQYFDINSCFLRDPTLGGLVESKQVSPFALKVSKSIYESYLPFTVSIVKSSSYKIDHSTPPILLESFIIQAIQADDDKIVGQWILKNDDESVGLATLDCFGEKNTLIKYGLDDVNKLDFEWKFDDFNQLENTTYVYFVASIVGSDQSYWLNIKSELIKLVKTSDYVIIFLMFFLYVFLDKILFQINKIELTFS